MRTDRKIPSFWHWFFGGAMVSKGGWRKIVMSRWLLLHICVGVGGAYFFRSAAIGDLAGKAVLPVSAIFIGLCFSWSGNALALLRDESLRAFMNRHPDGAINYIYTYQMGILVFLTAVVFWGAVGLVDAQISGILELALKFVGFALFSIAIRECWQLPLGLSYMLGIINEDKGR